MAICKPVQGSGIETCFSNQTFIVWEIYINTNGEGLHIMSFTSCSPKRCNISANSGQRVEDKHTSYLHLYKTSLSHLYLKFLMKSSKYYWKTGPLYKIRRIFKISCTSSYGLFTVESSKKWKLRPKNCCRSPLIWVCTVCLCPPL